MCKTTTHRPTRHANGRETWDATESNIAALRRLAGNRATSAAVQRLGDEAGDVDVVQRFKWFGWFRPNAPVEEPEPVPYQDLSLIEKLRTKLAEWDADCERRAPFHGLEPDEWNEAIAQSQAKTPEESFWHSSYSGDDARSLSRGAGTFGVEDVREVAFDPRNALHQMLNLQYRGFLNARAWVNANSQRRGKDIPTPLSTALRGHAQSPILEYWAGRVLTAAYAIFRRDIFQTHECLLVDPDRDNRPLTSTRICWVHTSEFRPV